MECQVGVPGQNTQSRSLPPAVLLLSHAGGEGGQGGEGLQQRLGAVHGGLWEPSALLILSLTPGWESLSTPLKATVRTKPLQAGGGGGGGGWRGACPQGSGMPRMCLSAELGPPTRSTSVFSMGSHAIGL